MTVLFLLNMQNCMSYVSVCTLFLDHDVCKLYCFAEGYDFFFALSNKVHDGTRCTLGSNNVCINGVCEVMCSYKQYEGIV